MIDGRTPTTVLPWGSPRADTVAAYGGAIATGFGSPGRSTTLIWQESQQNFAIKSVTP